MLRGRPATMWICRAQIVPAVRSPNSSRALLAPRFMPLNIRGSSAIGGGRTLGYAAALLAIYRRLQARGKHVFRRANRPRGDCR